MSNHNPDEKSGPRKPKVSLAMTISQRLGDPKAMAMPELMDSRLIFRPLSTFAKEGRRK